MDKQGRPLRVNHGTKCDVSAFSSDFANSKSNTGVPQNAFFAAKPDQANSFTVSHAWGWGGVEYHDGGNVVPVYLSIKRP